MFDIQELEKTVNVVFSDKELIKRAFTHSSYANENRCKNYEELEFLGDSILDFIVADYIMDACPDLHEGAMTVIRANVVSKNPLAEATTRLGLNKFLLLGGSESVDTVSDNIRADLFEAVIGAIYLDQGLEPARRFVIDHLVRYHADSIFNDESAEQNAEDNKTKLQQWTQKTRKTTVSYRLVAKEGPSHKPLFTVSVILQGETIATASGSAKRDAEQKAAGIALEKLTAEKTRTSGSGKRKSAEKKIAYPSKRGRKTASAEADGNDNERRDKGDKSSRTVSPKTAGLKTNNSNVKDREAASPEVDRITKRRKAVGVKKQDAETDTVGRVTADADETAVGAVVTTAANAKGSKTKTKTAEASRGRTAKKTRTSDVAETARDGDGYEVNSSGADADNADNGNFGDESKTQKKTKRRTTAIKNDGLPPVGNGSDVPSQTQTEKRRVKNRERSAVRPQSADAAADGLRITNDDFKTNSQAVTQANSQATQTENFNKDNERDIMNDNTYGFIGKVDNSDKDSKKGAKKEKKATLKEGGNARSDGGRGDKNKGGFGIGMSEKKGGFAPSSVVTYVFENNGVDFISRDGSADDRRSAFFDRNGSGSEATQNANGRSKFDGNGRGKKGGNNPKSRFDRKNKREGESDGKNDRKEVSKNDGARSNFGERGREKNGGLGRRERDNGYSDRRGDGGENGGKQGDGERRVLGMPRHSSTTATRLYYEGSFRDRKKATVDEFVEMREAESKKYDLDDTPSYKNEKHRDWLTGKTKLYADDMRFADESEFDDGALDNNRYGSPKSKRVRHGGHGAEMKKRKQGNNGGFGGASNGGASGSKGGGKNGNLAGRYGSNKFDRNQKNDTDRGNAINGGADGGKNRNVGFGKTASKNSADKGGFGNARRNTGSEKRFDGQGKRGNAIGVKTEKANGGGNDAKGNGERKPFGKQPFAKKNRGGFGKSGKQ